MVTVTHGARRPAAVRRPWRHGSARRALRHDAAPAVITRRLRAGALSRCGAVRQVIAPDLLTHM